MDISSGPDKLECQDARSFGGVQSLKATQIPDIDAAHDNDCSVAELGSTLAENLYIEEGEQLEQLSNAGHDMGKKNDMYDCERPKVEEQPKSSQKFLQKYASFPCPYVMKQGPASSETEGEKSENALKELFSEQPHQTAYACSTSLPAPLNLVSAMKGSREKHGVSPRKLSVSWAPDVYDPIPTSISHTVNRGGKKQQRYKNKKWKNGKKGQKGNSSRGSSGRDKKQSHKVSGKSNGCYKSMDTPEKLMEPNEEFNDLTVGSPDSQSFCGTSFLKNSLTKMHYPVAEAL